MRPLGLAAVQRPRIGRLGVVLVVVTLMPYLLMFPAIVVLRRKDPDRPRPFRMPGGEKAAFLYATVTTLVIAAGIVLFVWPEIPKSPEEWSYTGPLLGIVVVALLAGEAIVWRMFHPPRKTGGRTASADDAGAEGLSASHT